MVFSVSTLFLAALVFNAASTIGAPLRFPDTSSVVSARSEHIVPRAIPKVVEVGTRAPFRRRFVSERGTPLDQIARDQPEVREEAQPVVRRYPRRVYHDFYEKREPEPATTIKETVVINKVTTHDTPADAAAFPKQPETSASATVVGFATTVSIPSVPSATSSPAATAAPSATDAPTASASSDPKAEPAPGAPAPSAPAASPSASSTSAAPASATSTATATASDSVATPSATASSGAGSPASGDKPTAAGTTPSADGQTPPATGATAGAGAGPDAKPNSTSAPDAPTATPSASATPSPSGAPADGAPPPATEGQNPPARRAPRQALGGATLASAMRRAFEETYKL